VFSTGDAFAHISDSQQRYITQTSGDDGFGVKLAVLGSLSSHVSDLSTVSEWSSTDGISSFEVQQIRPLSPLLHVSKRKTLNGLNGRLHESDNHLGVLQPTASSDLDEYQQGSQSKSADVPKMPVGNVTAMRGPEITDSNKEELCKEEQLCKEEEARKEPKKRDKRKLQNRLAQRAFRARSKIEQKRGGYPPG